MEYRRMSDEPPKMVVDISTATEEEEEYFREREAEERNRAASRMKMAEPFADHAPSEHGQKDLDRRMWDAKSPSLGSPSFHSHLGSGHQKPGHSVRKG